MQRCQDEGETGEAGAAAGHQQRPHPPKLAQAFAGQRGARRMMAADPPHQARGKPDRAKSDQHAACAKPEPGGLIEIRVLLQRQQRKIERRMQRQGAHQHQDPA